MRIIRQFKDFKGGGHSVMSILHDGKTWEVVDMTWDGWVAVLIQDGFQTHYRAFLPFQEPTVDSSKAHSSKLHTRHRHTLN
jgi:hypothetical protein